jgi:hypothetical protein
MKLCRDCRWADIWFGVFLVGIFVLFFAAMQYWPPHG